ncbi:MAG: helix-turn-helix transcriptional regulator [Candidatus Omnitrophica bacterium]|nr:helix-turn-helix transcriptional regulator [Candidatus Omnitrophota bacterium]
MKEITVNEHLEEKLKNPYFKELYELEQQKYNIVRKIIDYRIKKKITQADLAREVGVSQQHISKIENGEFSSIVTLEKVLLHIGMTVRMKVVELNATVKRQIVKAMASA